jgi:hypothetical protein
MLEAKIEALAKKRSNVQQQKKTNEDNLVEIVQHIMTMPSGKEKKEAMLQILGLLSADSDGMTVAEMFRIILNKQT